MKELTIEYFREEYDVKNRSFADIAKEHGTYANAVRRQAIKMGIVPKDKSAAQTAALKNGRHQHPTKGKKRTEQEKLQISESMAKSWQNMSDEEYDKRVQNGREHWESMSEEEKSKLQKLAIDAVRKTSREGSQLEKFLVQHLKDENFLVEFHKKGILANASLEVDIFLPSANIAVEVDGPSHFMPIWGDESLRKTIKSDNEKNGLLILYNIDVVRIKQHKKNLSMKDMRDIAYKVSESIRNIELNRKTTMKANIYNVEVQ